MKLTLAVNQQNTCLYHPGYGYRVRKTFHIPYGQDPKGFQDPIHIPNAIGDHHIRRLLPYSTMAPSPFQMLQLIFLQL